MHTVPPRRYSLSWIGWIIACALALSLCLWRLGTLQERPLHGDEAVQGYILGELLETGRYAFNPEHFHGPLPHLINAGWMRPSGIVSYAQLEPFSLRIAAWCASIAGILCLCALAARIDCKTAALTLLLCLFSPLMFYYGGIYFHENFLLMAAASIPLIVALAWQKKRLWLWLAAGIALGALLATKSTWLMIALSWICATVALWVLQKLFGEFKTPALQQTIGWQPPIMMLATALIVAAALYTDGFARPQAAWDAIRTFFIYTTDPGHEKPWYYYLEQLLFFKGGFGEAAITIPACCGFVALLVSKKWRESAPTLLLWLALAGAAQIVGYSMVAYKTPWLMLVPVAYLAPWAAWVFCHAASGRPLHQTAIGGLLALLLAFNVSQIVRSRPDNEQKNPPPLAYVPTSQDVPRLTSLLLERTPKGNIAVVSPDGAIWPIPWYLRNAADRTGYYEGGQIPKDGFSAYIFVNMLPDSDAAKRLNKTHEAIPGILFLPGQPFSVYIPKQKP